MNVIELKSIKKIHNGKFLSFYNLNYKNNANEDKIYEIASRKDIQCIDDLATNIAGVTIVIKHKTENKYLLLKEFRMSVNDYVYNFVAGLIDEGEDVKTTVKREVFEETGLTNITITKILPPAFSALGTTDEKVYTVFAEVDGKYNLIGDSNPNELIYPDFYSLDEILKLLKKENFSSKTQVICYLLTQIK